MTQKGNSGNSLRGSLNTLAQNGTGDFEKPAIIVSGNGTEISNEKALKGRAKRKVITQSMILSLVEVAEKSRRRDRKKGYWNTYHCQSKLFTANGRVYGKFCKNRFCTLCCSIRKAVIINKYLPVLQTWSQPYFVTLTVKAAPLNRLNLIMKGVIRAFRKINSKFRKRYQRSKGIRLVGIKSLECNFNALKRTYNPHLHLIVADKLIADTLIAEWLKIWTSKFTHRAAQHSRAVIDRERDLIEIVKYGSKIFTEPDVNNKAKSRGNHQIHAAALDNIFTGMKGLRIFERFGFNLPKGNFSADPKSAVVQKYEEWNFEPKYFDWLNILNENVLSGYTPVLELIDLLSKNIDTHLE